MISQNKDKIVVQEFDLLAEQYTEMHKKNIAISGEDPDYFSEYKIKDLAGYTNRNGLIITRVLDFGCGIGNSIPYFRKYYSNSALGFSDVSSKSIEVAKSRFPGDEDFFHIVEGAVPVADASQDLVFSACVFHHISHNLHVDCLKEILRVTKKGGTLAIYEHNPFNPLTVRAVNTCPLDINAKLIKPSQFVATVREAGWTDVRIDFKLFFPGFLKALRPMENKLQWLPLGAQYRLLATKP